MSNKIEVVTVPVAELEQKFKQIALEAAAEAFRSIGRVPEVMTKAQLAEYWQCSERVINDYLAGRGVSEPIPHGGVGSHPRFYRHDVDQWNKRQFGKAA